MMKDIRNIMYIDNQRIEIKKMIGILFKRTVKRGIK